MAHLLQIKHSLLISCATSRLAKYQTAPGRTQYIETYRATAKFRKFKACRKSRGQGAAGNAGFSINPRRFIISNLRLLDSEISDTFNTALRRFFNPMALETDTPALKMRVDVSEKDDAYEVKADIPGVKKEDINVRIDGNVVQIDAEVNREKESKDKSGKVLRSERYWGNISRTFSLAQDVDDTKVVAKYTDGVLTLELPKKASPESKKISVQ